MGIYSRIKNYSANFTIYQETWIISVFVMFHLIDSPNRYYLIVILLLVAALYKVSANFLSSVWLGFISTLIFERGKYLEYVVVSQSEAGGWPELTFRASLLFADILLGILLYYILTRFREFRKKNVFTGIEISAAAAIFIFTLISALSVHFARFPITSTYYYLQFVKVVVLFFIAKIILTDKLVLKKTLQIFLLLITANAMLVILQLIMGRPLGLAVEDPGYIFGWFAFENPGLYRPGGFSTDPNISATFFAVFLPVVFSLAIYSGRKKSMIYYVLFVILTTALVFTASRAAWVVAAVGLFAVIRYSKRNSIKLRIPVFIQKNQRKIAIIFFIILSIPIFNRIRTLSTIFDDDGGVVYRIEHIKASWHFMKENPTGVGIGLFPFALSTDSLIGAETRFRPTLAHNVLAQIGAETGFTGLIIFCVFLWFLLRRKLRSIKVGKDSTYFSLQVAFFSLLLLTLVYPWFLHPGIFWLFWILAAV